MFFYSHESAACEGGGIVPPSALVAWRVYFKEPGRNVKAVFDGGSSFSKKTSSKNGSYTKTPMMSTQDKRDMPGPYARFQDGSDIYINDCRWVEIYSLNECSPFISLTKSSSLIGSSRERVIGRQRSQMRFKQGVRALNTGISLYLLGDLFWQGLWQEHAVSDL